MERIVNFVPGFDKRDPNPSKNYGIGSVRIVFIVKGEKGAVQWMIGSEWFPESARQHLAGLPTNPYRDPFRPSAWDLGYHAHTPQYEGQTPMDGDCDILGGRCFYDGSGLQAELPMEGFLSGGTEYLWPKLEAYYRCRFENGEWPFEQEAVAARAAGRFV